MAVRYKNSVEPVFTDGRDIDVSLGTLQGEAAGQQASGSSDKQVARRGQAWQPSHLQTRDPTYYDRPLLKEPVWKWSIPGYYYIGGLSGAAQVLGAAVELIDAKRFAVVAKYCDWIGFIGVSVSGVLLVDDLGRPSRFFHMLRVFRPTSPMNQGAWILSLTGGTALANVLFRTSRTGVLGWIGRTSAYMSALSGAGLATYTGVLLGNTAVPLWQEGRRVLPILFGASGMASLGSMIEILVADSEAARVSKAFGIAGQVIDLAAGFVLERQVSAIPTVAQPLHKGASGFLWKAATALTFASVAVGLYPGKSRGKRIAAGVLGTLGAICTRFAVHRAGVMSARDPRASFHQQRVALAANVTAG